MLDIPQCAQTEQTLTSSDVFLSCVLTRAQAPKGDNVSLSHSFLMPFFSGEADPETEVESAPKPPCIKAAPASPDGLSLPVSRTDATEIQYFSSVVSGDKVKGEKVVYLLDGEILMHKWSPSLSNTEWSCSAAGGWGWRRSPRLVLLTQIQKYHVNYHRTRKPCSVVGHSRTSKFTSGPVLYQSQCSRIRTLSAFCPACPTSVSCGGFWSFRTAT